PRDERPETRPPVTRAGRRAPAAAAPRSPGGTWWSRSAMGTWARLRSTGWRRSRRMRRAPCTAPRARVLEFAGAVEAGGGLLGPQAEGGGAGGPRAEPVRRGARL